MIGVFTRANHPRGYGRCSGHAHGYSVVFVRATSEEEMESAGLMLEVDGLPEPFGHPYCWYGGQFELLAILPTDELDFAGVAVRPDMPERMRGASAAISIGDNRFAGLYEASELLASSQGQSTPVR